ncbi:MAG: rhomboid family intramembrane serine protease [Polyangiales bacterium]
MDRFLARLERRFGNLAIAHLPTYIAGLSAIVWILGLTKPLFVFNLMLIPDLVLKGQVWRLFTYLFIPPSASAFWMIFVILFYWSIGQSLEEAWGKFKLNAYYLLGMLGTTIAAFATGLPMTSFYLHSSVFLAFGTMFPNSQVNLYFLIPIRVKWLALLDAAYLGYIAIFGSNATRFAVAAAMTNYLIFFGPHLYRVVRGYGVQAKQANRRADLFEKEERDSRPKRACKICGKTDEDGADLRVCTCQEVCGGKATVYCLEHARSHNKS